jgi:hypothetical protein
MRSWRRSRRLERLVLRISSAPSLFPFFPPHLEANSPPSSSPADFILDVVSIDHRSVEAEQSTAERVTRIVQAWKKQVSTMPISAEGNSNFDSSQPLKATPLWKAFPVVLARSFRNLRRQPDIFLARALNPPFLAILFWLYFLRLKHGPTASQDIIGLLQEMTALPFVVRLASSSVSFLNDADLFSSTGNARLPIPLPSREATLLPRVQDLGSPLRLLLRPRLYPSRNCRLPHFLPCPHFFLLFLLPTTCSPTTHTALVLCLLLRDGTEHAPVAELPALLAQLLLSHQRRRVDRGASLRLLSPSLP